VEDVLETTGGYLPGDHAESADEDSDEF